MILEIILIISFLALPSQLHIYVNTVFYLLLFVYIVYKKDFSIKEWFSKFKGGDGFWKKVMLTFVGFMTSVIITMSLERAFSNLDTGAIALKVNNWPSLICFILSTIILPAITEETVFRKGMISLNKKAIIVTSIISMVLFSMEHYLKPWGILLGIIWATPLTISYIKTKDVYIPMTAHFLASLFGNGLDIIVMLLRLV